MEWIEEYIETNWGSGLWSVKHVEVKDYIEICFQIVQDDGMVWYGAAGILSFDNTTPFKELRGEQSGPTIGPLKRSKNWSHEGLYDSNQRIEVDVDTIQYNTIGRHGDNSDALYSCWLIDAL